jgi:hypothetical protein
MHRDTNDIHRAELFNMVCGRVLGEGQNRTVYEHKFDSSVVIKMDTGDGRWFQNVAEWLVWDAVKDTAHAKWFAPCVTISECGKVLVQRRTVRAINHPEQVPAYMCDLKINNFGILVPRANTDEEERFVCHDYGLLTRMLRTGASKRMTNAQWWQET